MTPQTEHLAPDTTGDEPRQPDWWHRDHPTFTALTGFFAGLVFVVVVPALFAGLMHLAFDDETAESLFPFVLVSLLVPIGLVTGQRTRRFGIYMLIGMLVTLIVVVGVAGLVIWFMVNRDR